MRSIVDGGDNCERTERDRPRWFVLHALGWTYRDAVAVCIGLSTIGAILVNALFLQSGPHPAPMFTGVVPSAPALDKGNLNGVRPGFAKTRPTTFDERTVPARLGPEITADIQRELAARGFFDGVVDGRHGPRTDVAVRNFATAAGIKAELELNESLLAVIRRSNVKAAKPPVTTPPNPTGLSSPATVASAPRPPRPVRSDPIGNLLATSKRVLAIQRVLADFGYGQIKPTGTMDNATRSAIEKFERERNLPVTGTPSDRLARELTSITGRQVE